MLLQPVYREYNFQNLSHLSLSFYYDDEIKEDDIGGAYNTSDSDEKSIREEITWKA
jgi:hypothetical protein